MIHIQSIYNKSHSSSPPSSAAASLFFHLFTLVVTRLHKGRSITRRRDWDEFKGNALLTLQFVLLMDLLKSLSVLGDIGDHLRYLFSLFLVILDALFTVFNP